MNKEQNKQTDNRMTSWIAKKKKAGGRRLTVNLSPEANHALNVLCEMDDTIPTTIMNNLLLEALKMSNTE